MINWRKDMTIEKNITAVESLINVGGCRLNFSVIQGSDTRILLEVGGGADSTCWGPFPINLAEEIGATVVTYDRAGFGKSGLPDTPYNPVEETDWLMAGLHQLKLNQDLILVGHSYGGWRIRLFASQHPEAVRGLVFVDPFSNEFVDQLGVDYLDQHPFAAKDPPFDISNPAALTKNQRALLRMVRDGLAPKVEMMRKTTVPQNIPVRIITAGDPWWKTPQEDRAWRAAHEQMAAAIPGAVLIVAERCDHMIPDKQPEIIIRAVREVIKERKESS
jgi:pimeloyl-ACP methyl ester carboxylesterase